MKYMSKNILINAISARNGGGVTYIKNIIPYFSKYKGNNQISVIVAEDNNELEFLNNISGINITKIKTKSNNLLERSIFEIFSLPKIMRRNNFDILFAPGGTSLTMKSKHFQSVTMFRNVWPHYYSNSLLDSIRNIFLEPISFLKLRFLKLVIIFNCKGLDKAIFISDYGKKLINGDKVSKNQSIVIKHAIDDIFFEKQKLDPRFNLIPNKYLFYVSSFQPYKNHEVLINSFALVKDDFIDCPLVLIGKISKKIKDEITVKLQKMGLEKNVIILKEDDSISLAALYQNSFFNLFLSSCENCPNTMLEAMASRRPLLSSSKDPMPEFGRSNVTYCNPEDTADIAKKLIFIKNNIFDLEEKAEYARKSILNKKGWEKTAIETINFLIK